MSWDPLSSSKSLIRRISDLSVSYLWYLERQRQFGNCASKDNSQFSDGIKILKYLPGLKNQHSWAVSKCRCNLLFEAFGFLQRTLRVGKAYMGGELPSAGASALGSVCALTTVLGRMCTARTHHKEPGSNAMTFCHMRIEPCALFMELKSRSRARAVNRTSLGREVKFSVNTEAAPCGACNKVTNGEGHFPPHVVKFYKFFKPSVWDLAPSDGKKVHCRQCSD